MHLRYNRKLSKNVMTIYPGEFHISKDDIYIYTVLGSCISVCLYDPKAKVGGMNHFMLPGIQKEDEMIEENFLSQNTRYGMAAMEVLINEIVKLGGSKHHLVAKIFGGANMIKLNIPDEGIATHNAVFAKWFLNAEEIPILGEDIGKDKARKVYFNPFTGKAFLKHIEPDRKDLSEEIKYEKSLVVKKRKKKEDNDIELF